MALVGLFPPWVNETGGGYQEAAGLHFVLRPPPPRVFGSQAADARIDYKRVLLTWGALTFLTTAGILTVQGRGRPSGEFNAR